VRYTDRASILSTHRRAQFVRIGFEKVDSYQQRLDCLAGIPPQAAMACSAETSRSSAADANGAGSADKRVSLPVSAVEPLSRLSQGADFAGT
jgi:hypothetical protein